MDNLLADFLFISGLSRLLSCWRPRTARPKHLEVGYQWRNSYIIRYFNII